jgi:D-3-phosphoglycerate dehydrogenase
MKKVVISHRLYEDGMKLLEGNVDIKITNNGNAEEIESDLVDADAFIIRIGHIDRKSIMKARNLKVIARPGVGVDNVDIDAATEKGIPVVIAPGANTRSVAEHTLGLIFAASKDIVHSDFEMRNGNFGIRSSYKAFELLGKTLGLVGFGNIGREVAKLCQNIGMKVVVFDPFVKSEIIEESGYKYEDRLEKLLQKSDVVSIHVPLTGETRGMIGKKELNIMKSDSVIINCSRGGIVNENDLIEALRNNVIHSTGLDVFSNEPLSKESPFFKLKNVIVTPHMAAQTKEAAAAMATMAAKGVLDILDNKKYEYVANKEVYNHPKWRNIH